MYQYTPGYTFTIKYKQHISFWNNILLCLDRCLVSPINNGGYRVFNINFICLFISQSRFIHPDINLIGTLYDKRIIIYIGISQVFHLYNYTGLYCFLGNEKKKPRLVWCTEIGTPQNHDIRPILTETLWTYIQYDRITNTVIVILY